MLTQVGVRIRQQGVEGFVWYFPGIILSENDDDDDDDEDDRGVVLVVLVLVLVAWLMTQTLNF